MNAILIVLAALAFVVALIGYAAAWLFAGWAWSTRPAGKRWPVGLTGVAILAFAVGMSTFIAVSVESADEDMGGLAVLLVGVWVVAPSMLLGLAALAASLRLALHARRTH